MAVIGVGGIGSAVLHHLSKSGCKVIARGYQRNANKGALEF